MKPPESAPDDASEEAAESAGRDLASPTDEGVPEIERLAELVPEERRQEFVEIVAESFSHHSGWLPTPSDLAAYESILPGLAERIVRLPEKEQEHRHRYIETAQTDETAIKKRGQSYAIFAMLVLLIFSAWLAFMGDIAWAGRVAIGTIVAVVGIFVTGKVFDLKAAQAEADPEKTEK